MRIFVGVPWHRHVKRLWGGQNRRLFCNFGRHSYGTFRAEAILLRGVVKCLIGFPETLKCLTLSDNEMPFFAKSVFVVGLIR